MADLIVQKNEAITTLLFNRPDARNALSLEMRSLLRDSLMDAENDETVRCVVLKGTGGHFMAGGDVKSMKDTLDQNPKDTKNYFLNRIHDLHPIMFAMRRMAKPVIASVEGAAAGAGVSLALAADLVIADSDAFFTLAIVILELPRWLWNFSPSQGSRGKKSNGNSITRRSLHCRTS